MRKTILGIAAVAAMIGMATNAQAAYSVGYDAGTTLETPAISGFATTGSDMDGMTVTVTFIGGGTETAIWGDTGPGAGAAFGTGWSLVEAGDTYSSIWTLSNSSAGGAIASVEIDADPGMTVFDVIINNNSNDTGTAGSERGLTFAPVLGTDAPYMIDAMYIDAVALTGDAPVGDLWRRLKLTFSNSGGFGVGGTLKYLSDTDNQDHGGEIPAPAAMMLGMLGVGMVGWMRRRFA